MAKHQKNQHWSEWMTERQKKRLLVIQAEIATTEKEYQDKRDHFDARKSPNFTFHALERASQQALDFSTIANAWQSASENTLSENQKEHKFKKYGMASLQNKYFWDEKSQLLFTVHVSKSGNYFIQTITKGKGNFIR